MSVARPSACSPMKPWMAIGLSSTSAMIGLRMFSEASSAANRAMERLSTGKRINRASDDPAGAVAATKLKSQERTLAGMIKGAEREITRQASIDGSSGVVVDMVGELQTLLTMAASRSGTTDDERRAYQKQADGILQSIDYVVNTTLFDREQILGGLSTRSLGRSSGVGILAEFASGEKFNLVDGDLEKAQLVLDNAREQAVGVQAGAGIRTNQLQLQIRSWNTELENTGSARSMIEDADFAKETAALMRAQVLRQASLFALKIMGESDGSALLALLGGKSGK
jgi:flagellin